MKVAIIGPNLYDQTKGTFHVHTASCRDGKNGRKYPLAYRHEIDTDSQFDVAESVYSDHAGDYGYQPGDAEYDEYIADTVSDFHFHGCVADLPARAAKEAPA